MQIKALYKRSLLFRLTLNVLLLLLVYFAVRAWQTADVVRGQAPLFAATTLQDEAISLQGYRDQPLMLHFWAPWCPICRLESDSVASVSKDYQVMTVVSWTSSADEVHAYLLENSLQLPVVFDEKNQLAAQYKINAVPTSLFIDADGMIRYIEQGYTSEWGMRLRLWWLSVMG
ncbi:MAG TPA: redoxin domain-containing protein [Gammaproteobacteria bacterium]